MGKLHKRTREELLKRLPFDLQSLVVKAEQASFDAFNLANICKRMKDINEVEYQMFEQLMENSHHEGRH